MVRAAGLYGQVAAGVTQASQDGLTPAQQLTEINKFAAALASEQYESWTGLKTELSVAGIDIVERKELTPSRAGMAAARVQRPLSADPDARSRSIPSHPFPFIQNGGLTVGVELRRERDGTTMHALLPIPSQLARFIRLPGAGRPPEAGTAVPIRFMRIESMIGMFLSRLFPGFLARSHGAFRVLRDSDIEVQEEAEDLVALYETALKRRRRGHVIRLEIDGQMPTRLQRFVVQELEIREDAVFVKEGMLGLANTSELIVVRSAGSRLQAVQHPLSRAHPRVQRRLLRRHQQEGHRRPPPLRVVRRRRADAAPGRRRPQRDGHQVDALSNLQRQPDRARAEAGGRDSASPSPPWSS